MAQTQHRLLDWLHCLSVSAHTQQTQLCAALLAQIAERASMYGGMLWLAVCLTCGAVVYVC